MATKKSNSTEDGGKDADAPKPRCGIVMPISSIDGCNEQHWVEVKSILSDSIEAAGFEPNLVSDSDDVGIFHGRIITNLYDNPVVVCDVSGKNPNVMFELGLRLAFDKPTIIVKDEKTSYSFDTSPIEHLGYPRDLRFSRIVVFKDQLTDKIRATHERAQSDPSFSTFLKHFGEFKTASLDTSDVSKEDFIFEELRSMRHMMMRMYDTSRNQSAHGIPSRSSRNSKRSLRDLIIREALRIVGTLGDDMPSDPEERVELISELLLRELDHDVVSSCDGPGEFRQYVHFAVN